MTALDKQFSLIDAVKFMASVGRGFPYCSIEYVLKRVSFGSKECTEELKLECAYFWARLASFGHLGLISDPLIVSKFHNETHDS